MGTFREAPGARLSWDSAAKDQGFSNFLFVDREFASSHIIRRIFSLARKLNYGSVLIEELSSETCSLFQEENEALVIRCPEFKSSRVRRIAFLSGGTEEDPGDLLGYAVFKEDSFSNRTSPRAHVYESVMRPNRSTRTNNFLHTTRAYKLNSCLGELSVQGAIYGQQNDLTYPHSLVAA